MQKAVVPSSQRPIIGTSAGIIDKLHIHIQMHSECERSRMEWYSPWSLGWGALSIKLKQPSLSPQLPSLSSGPVPRRALFNQRHHSDNVTDANMLQQLRLGGDETTSDDSGAICIRCGRLGWPGRLCFDLLCQKFHVVFYFEAMLCQLPFCSLFPSRCFFCSLPPSLSFSLTF